MQRIRAGKDADTEQIAALTPGFTGADLANLVNEAAVLATRRGANSVDMEDFTAAIERIVAGLEKKNRILSPMERRTVAYHEMGHALVATAISSTEKVHKVSIIPRGIGALGYTIQRPTEDRYLMSRAELESKMCVLLGGPCGRDAGLRHELHRCFGRPRQGDRHRAQHGHAVRHGRCARSGDLREPFQHHAGYRRCGVCRGQELQRRDGQRD